MSSNPDTKITASPENALSKPAELKGTIILDTSFIHALDKIEQHCRKQKFRPEKTLAELPMAGLTHFMNRGCNIILPNEVLKEVFSDIQSRTRLGLSIKDGKPTLDSDLLAKQKTFSPLFKEYLQNALASDKVQCFNSVADYNASQASKCSGGIAIINGKSRLLRNGIEEIEALLKDKSDVRLSDSNGMAKTAKWGHGDAEILSIISTLNSPRPIQLLTKDTALAKKARNSVSLNTDKPVQINALLPSCYLDALYLSGFIDNPRTFNILMNQALNTNILTFNNTYARKAINMLGINTREQAIG